MKKRVEFEAAQAGDRKSRSFIDPRAQTRHVGGGKGGSERKIRH